MANIAFGSKYFIFSRFSSFPKTSKIEQARAALEKEFNEFNEFESSNELAGFLETEKYLSSSEFKTHLAKTEKELLAEEEKIKKFENQKKSKQFKGYFQFKESQKLKDFNAFAKSSDLARFEELKQETSASGFAKEKENLSASLKKYAEKEKQLFTLKKHKAVKAHLSGKVKKDDKTPTPAEVTNYEKLLAEINSTEFKKQEADSKKQLGILEEKEKSFKQLSKSSAVKSYFKFLNSTKYKNFQSFEKSKELADYLAMEKYLQSDDHKNLLKKLNQGKEAAANKQKEHDTFKNSKKYKWYVGLKGTNKFDVLKKWQIVFEDDFSAAKLNKEKWMTRYFWGDKLIGDAYALENDKAFPTDGKNIETGGNLKIHTRREKVTGKMWKQPFGFLPQEFDYTTGLVSTAKTHRQKFGKIEAKIKVNYAKPVNFHFWMTTDNNLPHIDILKLQTNKSQVDVGHVFAQGKDKPGRQNSEFKGLDVAQDFFIYTLEWSKEKLTWKINEVVVHEQTQNIPNESMYLVFNSSVTGKPSDAGLPASMEVDWVKCYQAHQ